MKLNEKRMVNDIRLLALDMIDIAGSGSPGIALSMAPTLFTLFAYHLKFDLDRKAWCNRDRLVISEGSASALLYASLFYCLDDFSIEQLRNYKELSSSLEGTLEYNLNNRVEVTTGSSGSGLATSVGMAIAEKYLESIYNKKKNTIFDYKIYILCSIEDLMEGISYEAISLAGNLALDNLIVLYDANGVTADGLIDKTFYENIEDRFKSMNWEVIEVKNGDSVGDISSAIDKAKKSNKPTLIKLNTLLGKYSKYEGTNKIYSNLEKEDLEDIRKELKGEEAFSFSEIDRTKLLDFIKGGTSDYYRDWYKEYELYMSSSNDKEKDELNLVVENEKIILDLNAVIDTTKIFEEKTMRDINYQIMNVIAAFIPNFIGGSADLFCNSKTYLKGKEEFSANNYGGRNIYYGKRENLMGAVMNGIALSSIRSYGSTYLTYSDYMKASIRLSAMMDLPVTYIFTDDSILSSRNGSSLEPVEQIGCLRSIPNMSVYRPCDYKELIGSWTSILKEGKPASLVLPSNHVNTIKYSSPEKVENGAYIVSEVKTRLDLILVATGSEVEYALKIKEELLKSYIEARVVSMPNMNLFLKQTKEYQEQVFPTGYRVMALELSNDPNWYRFIASEEDFIGVNNFGKTAKDKDILSNYELELSSIVIRIKNSL